MLVLREIKKENENISARYYPENGSESGYICISLNGGGTIKHTPAKGYEYSTCFSHAKKELLRLSSKKVLPTEKTIIWY